MTGKRKQFFENIRVKLDIPAILDKKLSTLQSLPQHLKRVQINETSDYYLPKVIYELKKINRDIMGEILDVFEKHAQNNNHWMLHILSKSNLILNHISRFKSMREMVQIEMSFATHDESARKKLEFYTIPTAERLKTVEKLAKEDVFVRIMAMPFYGNESDLDRLKTLSFNAGAKAFKHKGLNYYDWAQLSQLTYDDLVNDRITRVAGRPDEKNEQYMIKSGETYLVNGTPQSASILMPIPKVGREKKKNWAAMSKISQRLQMKDVEMIDCGYSTMSKINWGYIK